MCPYVITNGQFVSYETAKKVFFFFLMSGQNYAVMRVGETGVGKQGISHFES